MNRNLISSVHSTRNSPKNIDILVADTRWNMIDPRIDRLVHRAAFITKFKGTILLGNDRTIKALNYKHRKKNKPTNVLSFERPYPNEEGDIILALETIKREARSSGKVVIHHIIHLVIHGALHVQGYDHHHVGQARLMELKEAWLMTRLGLPNPWKSLKTK